MSKKLSKTLDKIRTPLKLLNAILLGGISFGQVVQFWGKSKSGKSTVTYQTAETFLQDYDNGEVYIIDAENNNPDSSRLEKVFNIHPGHTNDATFETVTQDQRVHYLRINEIEECFQLLMKLADKSKNESIPMFIIVDSISALTAKAVMDSIDKSIKKDSDIDVYAGGQSANASIITKLLNPLMSKFSTSWATVVFINQITIDRSNPYLLKEIAKGGYALRHSLNLSVKFNILESSLKPYSNEDTKKLANKYCAQTIDDDSICPITLSSIQIDKNKLGITDNNGSTIMIDNTAGGKINPDYELIESFGKDKGFLVNKGAWIGLAPAIQEKYLSEDLDYTDPSTGEIGTRKVSANFRDAELSSSTKLKHILKSEAVAYYVDNLKAVKDKYDHMQDIATAKQLDFKITI